MTRPLLLQGDVREVLKTFDEESIQCVVTSPPYWGLRDYGNPLSLWGGDPDCVHSFDEENKANTREHGKGRWNHTYGERINKGKKQGRKQVEWQVVQDPDNMPSTVKVSQGRYCKKCGSWEGCLGLETTPEQFVNNMVEVFQEVKRVLRKDGTVWLNLGDSFMNKNLVGIPWRVALALQADGWYLRSNIIWHKPNPMPESCKDRPTKSHEHIFLLTKSPKYYYDVDAIRESVSEISLKRAEYGWDCDRPSTKNASMGGEGIHTEKMGSRFVNPKGRNKRDVWEITTKPYKDAHFATFPKELPETCIKAGTKKGDMVLDIFAGSGTTLRVASKLGRNSIGIEINEEYLEIARKRCKIDSESLLDF